jgi:hypothetical protein
LKLLLAFVNKQHLVSIFFDLEKAYDTSWKYGILKDLKDAWLKGKHSFFISEFLNERHFKVRLCSTFTEDHQQEQGVPQEAYFLLHSLALK